MPFYPRSVASQRTCLNYLSSTIFTYGLAVEFIKEFGGASHDISRCLLDFLFYFCIFLKFIMYCAKYSWLLSVKKSSWWKGFFYVISDYGRKPKHVSSKINYFDLVGSYLWVKVLLTFVEFINLKLNKKYSFTFEDFLAVKLVKSWEFHMTYI
jgi:hypothetical protein